MLSIYAPISGEGVSRPMGAAQINSDLVTSGPRGLIVEAMGCRDYLRYRRKLMTPRWYSTSSR
jgi:hypothetical protein